MKTRPGLVIVWLIATLAGAAAFTAQNATVAPQPAPRKVAETAAAVQTPASWALQAPGSSDVVFVIKDAKRLRASPAGRALHDMLTGAGLMGDTRTSWDRLAKTLGWTRQEAFDALLGGQVMIVVSGIYAQEPVRWAVMSRVDEATDKRLIEKLAAAPRGKAAGHELLSVEHGEYELAVHRPRDGGEARAGSGSRVIVLGPQKRPELFERVLRGLDDTPAPGETPIFTTAAASSLKELEGGDAIVLVRMELKNPKDQKGPSDPWSAHTALSLTTDDEGMGLRCLVSEPTAAGILNSGAGGPAVDLDAAFTGALIATAAHRPTDGALEPDSALAELLENVNSPLTELLAKVKMPEALRAGLATGQMFVARASPASPGVACGMAVHVNDAVATAKEGDTFMASLIQYIEGEPAPGGPVAAVDFGGVAPRAVRSLPLASKELPELWVSWSFAPMTGAPEAAVAADVAQANADAPPESGWWVVGIAGGKAEEAGAGRALANDIVEQLHAAAPSGRGKVLSQGVVRPAALAKAVWPGVPDVVNWRDVLGRVSVIRWRFDAVDGGRMDGTVRVDLTPAVALPAQAPGEPNPVR